MIFISSSKKKFLKNQPYCKTAARGEQRVSGERGQMEKCDFKRTESHPHAKLDSIGLWQRGRAEMLRDVIADEPKSRLKGQ